MNIMQKDFEIEHVFAREILDGTGCPTVEADVWTKTGNMGRASVPSGTSKGKYEAFELRDGDSRYLGKGVKNAVENINKTIFPKIKGLDVREQNQIDNIMIDLDGSSDKSVLGANAILSVSVAVSKAAANSLSLPLYRYIGGIRENNIPVPQATVIAGGKFSGNKLDFEDFFIIPTGFKNFVSAVQALSEVFEELGTILRNRYGVVPLVGSAYAPPMNSNREAIETIIDAIEKRGYGKKFALGLDVAASNFFDGGSKRYRYGEELLTEGELIGIYKKLSSDYPIEVIEDPFDEDAFHGFAELTRQLEIKIVGDDLFATNKLRLKKGISAGAANMLLLKINQIGSMSEALEAAQIAYKNAYGVIISARSRECNDDTIADIAVGIGAVQIKLGAPSRGERNIKYNRLLRIEEELGTIAKY